MLSDKACISDRKHRINFDTVCFLTYLVFSVFFLVVVCLFVSAVDCLERLVSKMACYVSSGMLYYSLTS